MRVTLVLYSLDDDVAGLAVSVIEANAGRFDLGNLPIARHMSPDIKLCCAVNRP